MYSALHLEVLTDLWYTGKSWAEFQAQWHMSLIPPLGWQSGRSLEFKTGLVYIASFRRTRIEQAGIYMIRSWSSKWCQWWVCFSRNSWFAACLGCEVAGDSDIRTVIAQCCQPNHNCLFINFLHPLRSSSWSGISCHLGPGQVYFISRYSWDESNSSCFSLTQDNKTNPISSPWTNTLVHLDK